MTIQVGQISTPGQTGVTSRLIENQLTSVERFNIASFRLDVLKQLGLPEPNMGSSNSNEIFDTLRSVPAKSTDLINVQVSAYSREDALKALKASFGLFNAEHLKLFDPTIGELNDELKQTNSKLGMAERQYGLVVDSLQAVVKGNGKAETRDVLLNSTAATLNDQIVNLAKKKAELQETLAPSRTYPTRVFGELYSPDRPSTPGTLAMILIGITTGLVIGIAIVMLGHSLRKESSWS